MNGQGIEQEQKSAYGRGVDMTRRHGRAVLVALFVAVVALTGVISSVGQAHASAATVKVMHPCDIDGDQNITGNLGKLCREVWRQAAFSYKVYGRPTSHASGPNIVSKLRKKMDAEDWGPIQYSEALQDVRDKFNRRQNATGWQARAFDDPTAYGSLHPADTDDADGSIGTSTELLAWKVWQQPQFQIPKAGGGESRFGSGPWAVTNASDAWSRGAISERQYITYLKKYRNAYLGSR